MQLLNQYYQKVAMYQLMVNDHLLSILWESILEDHNINVRMKQSTASIPNVSPRVYDISKSDIENVNQIGVSECSFTFIIEFEEKKFNL
jgi:hypothetical protein